MRLVIQSVGNPQYPRFVIANDQGGVFDGNAWTNDRRRAILFAEGQEVAAQHNALQEQMFEQFPLREFAVPLNVRVRSAQPFTQKQLEEYLERAVSIILEIDKLTGSGEDSMVQLHVIWREMQEKTVAEDKDKPCQK